MARSKIAKETDKAQFFFSCFPEFLGQPEFSDLLTINSRLKQLQMVPRGTARLRNKKELRELLERDTFRKKAFEDGMVIFVKRLAGKIGKRPSSAEITEYCKKSRVIDLINFIYRCKLFDGHINNLYRKAGL